MELRFRLARGVVCGEIKMDTVSVIVGEKILRVYPMDKARLVAGRGKNCDIVIDAFGVSRYHCEFVMKEGAYVLVDLHSSNGTLVNGKKKIEHALNNGDEITVGNVILKYGDGTTKSCAVPDSLKTVERVSLFQKVCIFFRNLLK